MEHFGLRAFGKLTLLRGILCFLDQTVKTRRENTVFFCVCVETRNWRVSVRAGRQQKKHKQPKLDGVWCSCLRRPWASAVSERRRLKCRLKQNSEWWLWEIDMRGLKRRAKATDICIHRERERKEESGEGGTKGGGWWREKVSLQPHFYSSAGVYIAASPSSLSLLLTYSYFFPLSFPLLRCGLRCPAIHLYYTGYLFNEGRHFSVNHKPIYREIQAKYVKKYDLWSSLWKLCSQLPSASLGSHIPISLTCLNTLFKSFSMENQQCFLAVTS